MHTRKCKCTYTHIQAHIHMCTRKHTHVRMHVYTHTGTLGHFTKKMGEAKWDKVAKEAARTVPGRENGGNCDIKNLSRGCTVYFPVFVPGANLSMGDMHFSQGK